MTTGVARFLVPIALALIAAGCVTPAPRHAIPASLVEAHLQQTGLSGIAVTVGSADDILWSQGFGYADLEQRVPVDAAQTKFRVGSTAKSMTAVAVGQLYESGQLDLDQPVQVYVPEFPQKSGVITTRLLAGHLSGVRHYANAQEFLSSESYASVTDALAIFADDPLRFEPGTEFGYSTYGYNLISVVVERAARENFLDYMARRVFAPAGMNATVADRVTPLIEHRSRYYRQVDGELVNSPWVDNSNKWAGGGFLSTSDDLVRFGQAHLSGALLKPATIEMMWTSQTTPDGEATGYGVGWFVGVDDAGRKLIRHSGGSVGGITELRVYPEHDLVVAIITNTGSGKVRDLAAELAEHFLAPG